ncbi:MAG: DNA-binding protein [Anaerolineae bacterium]|nr:DNA-binding protein [Anaerolineae bacterium]
MAAQSPSNEEIARLLERIAALLEAQGENPFRVGAYRNAAESIRSTEKNVSDLVLQGREAELDDIPGVGERLMGLIVEYVRTGRSDLLDRLEAEVDPRAAFSQVPEIGEELANRIVEALDIRTLEELEQAAYDGRLEKVPGFGPERVEAVRIYLSGLLSRAAATRRRQVSGREEPPERPPVSLLLEVDEEYRRRAEAGELRKIAPRRFNPEGEAWLPVLETEKDGWSFSALYSNTARAHELGKTRDWVVIYYEREGREGQATVVTATGGRLEGKRVVRGREPESRRYYSEG